MNFFVLLKNASYLGKYFSRSTLIDILFAFKSDTTIPTRQPRLAFLIAARSNTSLISNSYSFVSGAAGGVPSGATNVLNVFAEIGCIHWKRFAEVLGEFHVTTLIIVSAVIYMMLVSAV
jgi:hypothetical protein